MAFAKRVLELPFFRFLSRLLRRFLLCLFLLLLFFRFPLSGLPRFLLRFLLRLLRLPLFLLGGFLLLSRGFVFLGLPLLLGFRFVLLVLLILLLVGVPFCFPVFARGLLVFLAILGSRV